MIADIHPTGEAMPEWATVFDGKIYFVADDSVHGRELWVTDGTEAGTRLFLDLNWEGDSSPQHLQVIAGELWFSANTPTHGREIWKTDGTPAGTTLVADIHPNGSSNPAWFTAHGAHLYFSAYTPHHGHRIIPCPTLLRFDTRDKHSDDCSIAHPTLGHRPPRLCFKTETEIRRLIMTKQPRLQSLFVGSQHQFYMTLSARINSRLPGTESEDPSGNSSVGTRRTPSLRCSTIGNASGCLSRSISTKGISRSRRIGSIRCQSWQNSVVYTCRRLGRIDIVES